MLTRERISRSGQASSSPNAFATKPVSRRFFSFVLSFCSASEPTWWFVMTSPSAETKDPDPPLEMRTEERMRCSAHFGSGVNPYFLVKWSTGSRLNSHMPSSAGSGELATGIVSAIAGRHEDSSRMDP
jgi:hypothetical protein